MKKEERLHRLLGDIDDDLVANAARKPIRKAVWVPAVAAAACVALTVGLWQGGVFSPAEIPVETPDVSTTGETTESYILVGGEEDSDSMQNDTSNHRPISSALKEKIQEYRDVNAVFQVVVFSDYTDKDADELENYRKSDKKYQTLYKQYMEASTMAEREKIYNDYLSPYSYELWEKYIDMLEKERISYAAKYSKTEPIYGYGRFGTGYYMELTADDISELAKRGGYIFKLAGEKTDLSKPIDD